ncbi:hypothetical protein D8I24_3082 (plasmid) [Cupriavidus necator H850]|nr:hypothetical protein D8I24_3082 [Cupriavidus necator H850]
MPASRRRPPSLSRGATRKVASNSRERRFRFAALGPAL